MCSDGSIPLSVREIDVTTEVVEETEKSGSEREDGTGGQDTAVLEKKTAPQEETSAAQEETSAAQDDASKKYVILMSKIHQTLPIYKFLDFCSSVAYDAVLLGCSAVSMGNPHLLGSLGTRT
jgi:hypothetical protein